MSCQETLLQHHVAKLKANAPLKELPDSCRTGTADAAKQAPHEGHQVLQPQMYSDLPSRATLKS